MTTTLVLLGVWLLGFISMIKWSYDIEPEYLLSGSWWCVMLTWFITLPATALLLGFEAVRKAIHNKIVERIKCMRSGKENTIPNLGSGE